MTSCSWRSTHSQVWRHLASSRRGALRWLLCWYVANTNESTTQETSAPRNAFNNLLKHVTSSRKNLAPTLETGSNLRGFGTARNVKHIGSVLGLNQGFCCFWWSWKSCTCDVTAFDHVTTMSERWCCSGWRYRLCGSLARFWRIDLSLLSSLTSLRS